MPEDSGYESQVDQDSGEVSTDENWEEYLAQYQKELDQALASRGVEAAQERLSEDDYPYDRS